MKYNQEMSYVIYKCTNKINGKIYIGKTKKGLKKRILTHKADWKFAAKVGDASKPLYNAFSKYGFENFSWEVIDTAETEKELNEKEKYWINELKSSVIFENYNIGDGGEGGDNFTNNPNKDRIVENFKKRKHFSLTDEHKKKLLEGRKRYLESEKSKESFKKISNSLKEYFKTHEAPATGRPVSEQTREKIRQTLGDRCKGEKNPNFGHKWTQEMKDSLSMKQKGKYDGSKNPNCKPVRIYNIETGTIEEFPCRFDFCSKYGIKYDTAEQNSKAKKITKKIFIEIPSNLESSLEEFVNEVKGKSRWYKSKQ